MPNKTNKTKKKNSPQTMQLKPNETLFDRAYSNLTSFVLIKKKK